MKKLTSVLILLISFVNCLASSNVEELNGIAIKFLKEKGIQPSVKEGTISWKNSDNDWFEIQIAPTGNLFILQVMVQYNLTQDNLNSSNIYEKFLTIENSLESRIPFIRLSISPFKGGDLAIIKGGDPTAITGYSCRCNVQNYIMDDNMLKEVLPFFYELISKAPKNIKEIIEGI